jgi:hypothetical protein
VLTHDTDLDVFRTKNNERILVNIYPKKSRCRAVQPQMVEDFGDSTISRVSTHEGGKNGSPTVWKEGRAAVIPFAKPPHDNFRSHS